jgi:hypothetical protein
MCIAYNYYHESNHVVYYYYHLEENQKSIQHKNTAATAHLSSPPCRHYTQPPRLQHQS